MNTATIVPGGFPAWLPAVLVKELRQGLRTRGFVFAFIGFQGVMSLLMLGAVYAQSSDETRARAAGIRGISMGGGGGIQFMEAVFWFTLAAILLVIIPGRGLLALKAEIEGRTVDLLVLSRLTAMRIVFGKWAALLAQATLLMIAMLPYGIVRYFSGSADLLVDAGVCVLLLAASALLTAAALWASAMPRFIGGIIGLGAAVGIGTLVVWLFDDRSSPLYRGMGSMGGAGSPVPFLAPFVIDGVLLMFFCLVAAVRRIAPVAENQAPLSRLLGLAALASYPVVAWASSGSRGPLEIHSIFLLFFLPILCVIELSCPDFPLAIHRRKFSRFGPLGRVLVPVALPGWPSAMIYTVLLAGLGLLMVATFLLPQGTMRPQGVSDGELASFTWVVVLICEALIFPPILLSLFRKSGPSMTRLYFMILMVMAVAGLAGVVFQQQVRAAQPFHVDLIAGALPGAGVIVFLAHPSPMLPALQGIVLVAVVVLGIVQSRPYWIRLRELSAMKPKLFVAPR